MRPENWQLEEAIMLIELYFINIDKSAEQSQQSIEHLSALLRHRAIILHKSIDERYRNVNGIKLQLESIRYLMSNGEEGIDCPSKASVLALQLYKQMPDVFSQLSKEFSERYQVL